MLVDITQYFAGLMVQKHREWANLLTLCLTWEVHLPVLGHWHSWFSD